MNLKINRYLIFPISLAILQLVGFNLFTILLFTISTFVIISLNPIRDNNNANKILILFAVICLLIGIIHLIKNIPNKISILTWTQFFFIALFPLFIKNKSHLLFYLKKVIILIFLLDLFTNTLLFLRVDIPWAQIPVLRPGEYFSRLPGIKSSLYSGLISFLSISIFLEKNKKGRLNLTFICLSVINILWAGSYRTIILSLVVITLAFNKTIRKSKLLLISFLFIAAITTILATFYTIELNGSNLLRTQLWIQAISNIQNSPWVGHGFFSPDLTDVIGNFDVLNKAGVTESFFLLIAYAFGIPSLILFIVYIFQTLVFKSHERYSFELGAFSGLSIELFFGGSLDNTLALAIFFLSAYVLNKSIIDKENNYYNIPE